MHHLCIIMRILYGSCTLILLPVCLRQSQTNEGLLFKIVGIFHITTAIEIPTIGILAVWQRELQGNWRLIKTYQTPSHHASSIKSNLMGILD
jgi:hypothetical protein